MVENLLTVSRMPAPKAKRKKRYETVGNAITSHIMVFGHETIVLDKILIDPLSRQISLNLREDLLLELRVLDPGSIGFRRRFQRLNLREIRRFKPGERFGLF